MRDGLAGLIEAEATLADVARKFQRLLGPSHPDTKVAESSAAQARRRIDGRSVPLKVVFTTAEDAEPSIKEMKAAILAAGLSVADLVEKSDVVARYRQVLARIGAGAS